jgi:predicted small lipoprotein YifL
MTLETFLMQRRLILLILIPYSIALIGCGQSGALYYPKAPLASPREGLSPTQTEEPPLERQTPLQQTEKQTHTPNGHEKVNDPEKLQQER